MASRKGWSREELLVAFGLYCRTPFGRLHSRNPDIINYSQRMGRTPSALAMKLTNIASLDPAVIARGRTGLSGASLADRAMWEEMQTNWESFALESEEAITQYTQRDDGCDASGCSGDDVTDYTGLDKEIMTKARIRQSFFRLSVLSSYGYRCCITGLATPELLVASHIVPWRLDPANRLNPRNGLSLSALHDKAFDLGIITINEDMTIRVSHAQNRQRDRFFEVALIRYENKPIAMPEKFAPAREFLAYHREKIFQGQLV